MRAVRIHRFGGPEVLAVEEIPAPQPPEGAIRIRTSAVSVNPIDYKIRRGDLATFLPLPFPIVPGRDAAGVVDAIGDGVDGVALGDRVFGLGGVADTWTEHAVLSAWAPWPESWDAEQAAAAGLASVTALRALERLGEIDGTLLVVGAGGAIGSATVAAAVARGIPVVGTASAADQDYVASLGAIPVLYGDGVAERVRAVATPAAGLDTVGGDVLTELVEIVGDPDRVVTVVAPHEAEAHGTRWADGQNDADALREASRLGATGAYTPRIGRAVDVADAPQAHRLAELGGQQGKVVVTFG